MADQQILEILLKFGLDKKAAVDAAKAIDDVDKKAKNADQSFKKTAESAKDTSSAIGNIGKAVGQLVTVAAVTSAISNAVSTYVSKAGVSEKTSREWLAATQTLENSWVRIGRTLADAVLPQYQALAKLSDNLTQPGLTFEKGADASAEFINSFFANQPDWVKKLLNIQENAPATTATAVAQRTSDLYGVYGGRIGPPAPPGYSSTSGVVGQGGVASQQTGTMIGADVGQNLQLLEMLRSFNRAAEEAERSKNLQLYRMDRDFEKQQTYAVEDFNRTRTRADRDFNIQLAYSEKEFYRQRSIQNRDFNIQLIRNEQDYQRTRARATQDHEFDLYQIALSGDAMQYWLSQRQFNIDKQRSEEDYNIQKQRSKEDLARSQADQQEAFNIQRAQQLLEYNISRADAEQDFNIQRERQKYQYAVQLQDLEVNFQEQARLREQALDDQIAQMQTDEARIQALRNQFTQRQLDDFANMMNAGLGYIDTAMKSVLDAYTPTSFSANENVSGYLAGSYQEGGYTKDENARLHKGEFVLTKDTVQAAERVAKTNLTQDTILRLMTGGGGGLTYNDNRRIDTAISAEDRRAINNEQRALLLSLLPN